MESDSDVDVAAPSPSAAGTSQALESPQRDGQEDGAPRYRVAPRNLSAVEIPAIVEDVDRAIKAFGRVPTLAHVRLSDLFNITAPILTRSRPWTRRGARYRYT